MQKPELIAFSQYKLGGVQNFYYNLLSKATGDFDILWIFEDVKDGDPPLPKLYGITNEVVFPVKEHADENIYGTAKRLKNLVSNREGVVLANFPQDLATLHLHRRSNKTIFFVCHDEGYLPIAQQFEFLIDVFIAHNYQFYVSLREMLKGREGDVFYLPYGVDIPATQPTKEDKESIQIVMAARLVKLKGVYDIPVIDELLKQRGVAVNWTIIGDGPEKEPLKKRLLPRGNFAFATPDTTEEVVRTMTSNDIYILPSRLDGLPVSMLEAMSVGCVPVISAFNDGIKQVVTPKEGFVLPLGDNKQFAETIAMLAGDRKTLRSMGNAAYEKVREEYNGPEQAKRYFELFKKYKELKKPVRRKLPNYGGFLEHPIFPRKAVSSFRRIKKLLSQ